MARMSKKFPAVLAAVILVQVGLLSALAYNASDQPHAAPVIGPEILDSMKVLPGNLGKLPDVPIPADNQPTAAKIELGKRLFFEKRLSGDASSSCATCHAPEKAFTDGLARSTGFKGATLRRNAPTVLNAAYNTAQFWDGRAATLDEQCKGPLLSPAEMNMASEAQIVERLSAVPGYRKDFQEVFGGTPSLDSVVKAISAFERTLVTPDSRFDRYASGDKQALTDQEKRGLVLFFGKAACSECHQGPNFSDNKYHNLGALTVPGNPDDQGRFEITQKAEDRGAFKTPTVRNVALTGPYMHDGSLKTLEDVIEFYDRGGDGGPNKSKLVYRLELSQQEKADLVAFLKSLTGTVPQVQAPVPYPEEIPAKQTKQKQSKQKQLGRRAS